MRSAAAGRVAERGTGSEITIGRTGKGTGVEKGRGATAAETAAESGVGSEQEGLRMIARKQGRAVSAVGKEIGTGKGSLIKVESGGVTGIMSEAKTGISIGTGIAGESTSGTEGGKGNEVEAMREMLIPVQLPSILKGYPGRKLRGPPKEGMRAAVGVILMCVLRWWIGELTNQAAQQQKQQVQQVEECKL
jgi:hypothetical protein